MMRKFDILFLITSSIIPTLFFWNLLEKYLIEQNFHIRLIISILVGVGISYIIFFFQSSERRKINEKQHLLYDHAYAGLIERLEDILTRRKEKLNEYIDKNKKAVDIFIFVPKNNKYIVLASSEVKASLTRKIELNKDEGIISSTFRERIPLISKLNGDEEIFTKRGEFFETAKPLSAKNFAYCANEIKSIICIPIFSPPRKENRKGILERDIIGVISFDIRYLTNSFDYAMDEKFFSLLLEITEEVEAYVLADYLLSS